MVYEKSIYYSVRLAFPMLDKQDMLIVKALRQNSRIKMTLLSRALQVPVSTLHDRVNDPAQLGITRLSALLDFTALGYLTCATMLLKCVKRDELKAFLLNSPCVNSLMRVNNGYDFMVECVFRDMREVDEFCDKLDKHYDVKRKEVHYVVEELKRESFLAEPPFFSKQKEAKS